MTLVDEIAEALIPYSNLTSPNCSDHVNRLRAQAVQNVVERRLLSDEVAKYVNESQFTTGYFFEDKRLIKEAWGKVKGGDV